MLFWGIFGALALRAVFIFAGTALIDQFWWMLLVFGVVLLVSGFKVLRHQDDEGQHGHDRAVKLLGRFLPVRSELAGQHFVVRSHRARPGRKWVATPLLAALVVVEVTDVVFAVDSVPAILAVSRDRSSCSRRTRSRSWACARCTSCSATPGSGSTTSRTRSGAILVFVGIKMIVSHWWHFPTVASLGVIVAIVAGAIGASVVKTRARSRYGAAMKLAELVVPESTVVLTQECQKGVIGDLSLLPALAESAKAIGLVENVNRLVTTGPRRRVRDPPLHRRHPRRPAGCQHQRAAVPGHAAKGDASRRAVPVR